PARRPPWPIRNSGAAQPAAPRSPARSSYRGTDRARSWTEAASERARAADRGRVYESPRHRRDDRPQRRARRPRWRASPGTGHEAAETAVEPRPGGLAASLRSTPAGAAALQQPAGLLRALWRRWPPETAGSTRARPDTTARPPPPAAGARAQAASARPPRSRRERRAGSSGTETPP